VLWVVCAAVLAMPTGCGHEPRQPRPAVVEGPLVKDLLPELQSARLIRLTRQVEPGNPDHGGHLIEGWGRPETSSDAEKSFAWVTGRRATLQITRLDSTPARLEIVGWPLRWDQAPDQEVEVLVNGTSLGSETLRRRRARLRFSVPEGVFQAGTNFIELRFAYAEQPAKVHPGSTDDRSLSAAIHHVRISGSRAADDGRGEPRLRGGTALLPLDTGAAFRFRVEGDVALILEVGRSEDSSSEAPRIVVYRQPARGGSEVLLAAEVGREASSWQVPVSETTGGGPTELVVAAVGGRLAVSRLQLVGDGAVTTPRNLLLIVMDTLRADRVGSYGGEARTPTIDGLAESGTLFERAYSHIAITGPSHSSMFTGLYPFEHGVLNNARILPEDHRTLAETLEDQGWFTAGVISLGVLIRDYGTAQGFRVYRDSFERDWMKNAAEVTDEALAQVASGLPQPYFLWAHYSDPHEPYTPPGIDYPTAGVAFRGEEVAEVTAEGRGNDLVLDVPPGDHPLTFTLRRPQPGEWFRVAAVSLRSDRVQLEAPDDWIVWDNASGSRTYTARLPASLHLVNPGDSVETVRLHFTFRRRLSIPEVRQRYLQEVEYADRQIGRLLAALDDRGLLDNTVIVFTSDHGEGLGDHNHVGHIHQVYDTLIRVPLIMAARSGLPRGLRVPDAVSLVDLFPTVAEILGVDGPVPASGRSLVPLLEGETMPARDILAETHRPEAHTDKRAIIRDGFKYLHSWSEEREWEELYDLEADPDELEDLIGERPELAAELRRALEQRLAQTPHGQAEEAELSDEEVDRLRALGYVH
jgi:arylsulfatase A-like enzyme